MRILPVLLLLALFIWCASAEFQQLNLSVSVIVKPDGTAKVTETVRLSMDSGSPVIYDTAMTSYDLTSWRSKTKLDLRFHFNRDIVDISDVSIIAQPRDGCSECVRDVCTICYGTLLITYDLAPIANKSDSGLFKMDRFKPRTINFTMNPDAFSFESSAPGGTVLPENTQLAISLPEGAFGVSKNPRPDISEPANAPEDKQRVFTWKGRVPLNNFKLSFYTEEPLSAEVMGFFSSVRDDVLKVLYSREGLAIAVIAVVVVVSFIVLRRRAEE